MPRPMTVAEKILAAHAGLDEVRPGQLVECDLDLVLANDITAPIAIDVFRELGATEVFDRDRVCLVPDHYAPNKDIKSAEQTKKMRDFAHEQKITHYWEQGCAGIEHALLPETGTVVPGDLVIGADSHTCTYGALGAFSTGVGSTDAGVGLATGRAWFKVPPTIKFEIEGELADGATAKDIILHIIGLIGVDGALYQAMEFTGSTIASLSMEGRMCISNMAIEAGGKAGIMEVDDVARAWLEGRCQRPPVEYHAGRRVRAGRAHRRGGHQAVCELAAPAEQHAPGERVRPHHHRPGGDRLVHERANRGYARRRRGAARTARGRGRALHRDPRDAGGLQAVHGRGPGGCVHRCRLRVLYAYVRPVPGRLHGHPCRGRALRVHDEPQLRGPHGRPDLRGVSGEPGRRRCERRGRPHLRPIRPVSRLSHFGTGSF